MHYISTQSFNGIELLRVLCICGLVRWCLWLGLISILIVDLVLSW